MRFNHPFALLLLLLIPGFILVGWPYPGWDQRRRILALCLRMVIAVLIVFAIAGLEITHASQALSVVFVIDVSDSIPYASQMEATRYVQQALRAMGPDDQAAVVVFGENALVERDFSSSQTLEPITSRPNTMYTDVEEAMRLALALYPPGSSQRMVILSDGAINTGDPESMAKLLLASGVDLRYFPLPTTAGPEAFLSEAYAPTSLHQGEAFDLELRLHSNQTMASEIVIIQDDQLIFQAQHELNPGFQTLSIPLIAQELGFHRYQIQIYPESDTHPQNNQLASYCMVEGPPQIAIVSPPAGEPIHFNGPPRPDEYSSLLRALKNGNYRIELLRPTELPHDFDRLLDYAAIILVDTPARSLSPRQMESLQSYVRDLGGGLITIGGPTSYGVGGYYRTRLEEMLPVEMQIKDEVTHASVTMVFIIDQSGSMSDTSGGVSKVELAKEATMRSIELLTPLDQVGVIAFDEEAQWVVPIQDLNDPMAVLQEIATIRASGGTDILAGLQAMARELPKARSTVKHVLLLTDGQASPAGIAELVATLHERDQITLSTIGIGHEAADFLADFAEIGGGRSYNATDPSTIPAIFTEETYLAARSYIVEKTIYPRQNQTSPILSGISEAPPLLGYVATEAKQSAQTILISDEQDPILAAWHYGLGRTIAFTSDACGRWGKHWVTWDEFSRFWSQVVGYAAMTQTPIPLQITVREEDQQALIVLDAQDLQGKYMNNYQFQTSILHPDGQSEWFDLEQVAPGRYEGSFHPSQPGSYLIHVLGELPSDVSNQQATIIEMKTGWVQSYSPEYKFTEIDQHRFDRVIEQTGGQSAPIEAEEVFAHDLVAAPIRQPIWPWLLLLAAILHPLDIAVRRLILRREDWGEIVERAKQAFGLRPLPSRIPAARMGTIRSLLRVKENAIPSPIVSDQESMSSKVPASQPAITSETDRTEYRDPETNEKPSKRKSQKTTAAWLLEQKRARKGPEDRER